MQVRAGVLIGAAAAILSLLIVPLCESSAVFALARRVSGGPSWEWAIYWLLYGS